jgi:hypothetical protein
VGSYKIYYKEEGVASSKYRLWWMYVCPWWVHDPKLAQEYTHHIFCLFVQLKRLKSINCL